MFILFRTLYFKFAVFATKAGRLHQARSALEASLSLNQPYTGRPTYPHVKVTSFNLPVAVNISEK